MYKLLLVVHLLVQVHLFTTSKDTSSLSLLFTLCQFGAILVFSNWNVLHVLKSNATATGSSFRARNSKKIIKNISQINIIFSQIFCCFLSAWSTYNCTTPHTVNQVAATPPPSLHLLILSFCLLASLATSSTASQQYRYGKLPLVLSLRNSLSTTTIQLSTTQQLLVARANCTVNKNEFKKSGC